MSLNRYQTKPNTVQAFQFSSNNIPEAKRNCGDCFRETEKGFQLQHTSYGWVDLFDGDYIVEVQNAIKVEGSSIDGLTGETLDFSVKHTIGFYRTPKEIFEQKYSLCEKPFLMQSQKPQD